MLADQPRLQPDTLNILLSYFASVGEAGQQAIIFPVYEGKRGNPVIFGSAYFEELAALEGDTGGRAVVRAHPQAAIEIPVPDPAIHEDVDTPEDLARLRTDD
jgi:molybdenum cofactor cytidylyltransferase